jgi:hypothetical protein
MHIQTELVSDCGARAALATEWAQSGVLSLETGWAAGQEECVRV